MTFRKLGQQEYTYWSIVCGEIAEAVLLYVFTMAFPTSPFQSNLCGGGGTKYNKAEPNKQEEKEEEANWKKKNGRNRQNWKRQDENWKKQEKIVGGRKKREEIGRIKKKMQEIERNG